MISDLFNSFLLATLILHFSRPCMYRIYDRTSQGATVSIFIFVVKKTVHFFRQKNTVHRNILGQKSTGRSDGLISCVRYLNAAQFRKYVFLSTFFHPENNRKTYKNSVRAVLFATTIHISGKSTVRPVLFVEFGAP